MSNLVETLLDKLIYPSLSGKESPKNFSGSQTLVGDNVRSDSALVSEFHQILNSYTSNYPAMNAYSGVKNSYLDKSNFLVSRVSKLFLPSLVPPQDLHNLAPFTRRGSILSEIIDLFVNNLKMPSKDMPQAPPIIPNPRPQKVNSKAPMDSAHSSLIMNAEFVNRKAKKLNKQSKKRRRREKNRAKPSPPSGKSCDIISFTDVTSYVISVKSVLDEDTDNWDVCSDSDWLDDCSEFEVTGMFLSNLTAPTINSCPAHLKAEDKEVLKLRNLLQSMNKAWEESTLDRPRLSPKVSFAPDQDLVRVCEVDVYERKGEWELYALDRKRFKDRIDHLESVISPCLKEEHREKVFQTRHNN